MASGQQVTVDKSYFDALLRRADFHTTAQLLGRQDPASVSISKAEYDTLLRESREFQLLKDALFSGGITPETLALLINGTGDAGARKDSAVGAWGDDFDDRPQHEHQLGVPTRALQQPSFTSAQSKYGVCNGDRRYAHITNTASEPHRHLSYGEPPSSIMEDATFDDEADSDMNEENETEVIANNPGAVLRTLYFTGMSARTTHRDLLSVIKGGKVLSINMRSGRSATVTFYHGAADYLAWVKRNDIYLHGKRVEVRWAQRQFRLNSHIEGKISNGATRNILIRSASEKGFTENRIRDDMEHIHNLVIVDLVFRDGNAYVYTNSVHNALFARTCMMSRRAYKGCKIEFFRDECDVQLPTRELATRAPAEKPSTKKVPLANRFDMLRMDGSSHDSDEENRTPAEARTSTDEDDEDEGAIGFTSRHGISLQFLDSDSVA